MLAAERTMANALWPIMGVAGIGLARAATSAVSDGLSFAAELARGLAPRDAASEPSAAELQKEQLQQRMEALAARIKQQLAEAGIEVTQPLTLTSDGLGGLTALDHPQRAAIESLLEGDVLLLRDFDRLREDYESVAAAAGDDALAAPFEVVVTAAAA
jgi:hypothetical protein